MKVLKNLFITSLMLISTTALGQIQHNVNKTTGTVSQPTIAIDSIRFNGNQTEMEIILQNGGSEIHSLSTIINVTFFGADDSISYPSGSVFCNGAPTAIVDVTNPATGRIWMDRNLGATQVATSSTDANSYGDLYQWGRRSDSHQCRTSPTTTVLSSTDQPSHGDFVLAYNTPFDWRSPQNNNLWQGLNGFNNPCPSGYRLPTEAELNIERLSWGSNNAAGAFASPLKLPVAGLRVCNNGSLVAGGILGRYWSSTVSSADSRFLFLDSNSAVMSYDNRAYGFSVRCIKD